MIYTIKKYAQAIIAGVLILALLAFGAFCYRAGGNAVLAKQAKEDAKLAAVEERAAKGAASQIAKIKVVNQTTKQVLEREIVSNPLPDGCRLSDDGVRALNAIIEGRALPAGGSQLPEADAAH